MESASAAPKKQAGKTTSRHASVSPTHQTTSKAPPSAAASSAGSLTKKTTAPASTTDTPVVIKPIAKLNPGTSWKSDRIQLGMQLDGNLVLYDRIQKRPLWAAGVFGEGNIAYFQDDGNLVVYTAAGRAIWASNPAGFTNATLTLQPDGNVVIMAGGKQVWATNTHS